MGKRRSQMRQNVDFQRLATPPQQPGGESDLASGPSSPSAGAIRLAPAERTSPRVPLPGGMSSPPIDRAAGRMRGQVQDQIEWLEDNPLVLTLGGVALGVLAGLVLPVSDAETERLSAVSENITDQVQGHVQAIGQDVVEHGKAVLVETLQATMGGKSPVDAAQQSVQEHLATVAQNAQERVEASLSGNQPDA